MTTSRAAWAGSGVLAGLAGLATSHLTAMALVVRESPVVAVGEAVIELTPGPVAKWAVETFGFWDKTVLVGGILLVLCLAFAVAGLLARRSWWLPALVFGALAALGTAALLYRNGSATVELLPLAVGFVTWLASLSVLTAPLEASRAAAEYPGSRATRRGFLLRAGVVAALAAAAGVGGEIWGRGRRAIEETRRLLRLPLTMPPVPDGALVGLDSLPPWQTPNEDFYLIHTALVYPTIEPEDFELRIHGLVDRELTLSYQDLVERELTEAWITLNCVSNPVGGDLIGNAWWSGVRLADLLAEAGVQAGADAVLQTSHDGWTCGTPLSVLTDDRNAMLAVGMNGVPLPVEHGFPVRTIVPGLYGFVSACKWVVDLEVTRFDLIRAYWTERGWAEQAPVRLASRVDVPASGEDVPSGALRVGGVAWAQHTGIAAVEVAVDGGAWQEVDVSAPGTDDTWVQWAGTVEVSAGEHTVRVRATDKDGEVQTGTERDVIPDGATGWHEVSFTAAEA